jgi:hypothetical protein
MPEHPLNFTITSELAGIVVPTRARYERWQDAFVKRWGAIPERTEFSMRHAQQWQVAREVDIDDCTFAQAIGLFLAHELRTPTQAAAFFLEEMAKLPADYNIPLEDEDWNRIEHQEFLRERDPEKRLIDMNPRSEDRA